MKLLQKFDTTFFSRHSVFTEDHIIIIMKIIEFDEALIDGMIDVALL